MKRKNKLKQPELELIDLVNYYEYKYEVLRQKIRNGAIPLITALGIIFIINTLLILMVVTK